MRTKKKKAAKEKKYPFARRNSKGQLVVEDKIGEKKHKLLIVADEELWADLWHRYDDDDYIVGGIHYNYVQVALEFAAMENSPRTRGKSANQPWALINRLKMDSRHLYAWIEYWKTKPKGLWPVSLKKLFQRLGISKIGLSEELTKQAVKEIHYHAVLVAQQEHPSFTPFVNQDNYYKTYIMGDNLRRPKKHRNNALDVVREILIGAPGEEKNKAEIAALPKTDVVLNRVFKSLRVEP